MSSSPWPRLAPGGCEVEGVICWTEDLFGGCIVNSPPSTSEPAVFGPALAAAVKGWREDDKRGIWLKLPLDHSCLIPCAAAEGFDFHHAEVGYVMMTLWLPDEPSTLPPSASTQVGVGALVLNAAGEMLVVQEVKGPLKGRGVWKMPTGLLLAGEDFADAVEREVQEETGIRAEFDAVLAVRHSHGFMFGKSDLFVLCALRLSPGEQTISIQEDEIEAATWLPMSEYMEQDTFQAPLYALMSKMMAAYASGEYKGLTSAKLSAATPFSARPRQDVLVWAGSEGEGGGGGGNGSKPPAAL